MNTFYEKDGEFYESVIEESNTLAILKSGGFPAMALRGELQRFANNAMKSAHEKILGLSDKSWLERFDDSEQRADANAMMNLIEEKYSELKKRLFRQNEDLYNFFMLCAICAFDQRIDMG